MSFGWAGKILRIDLTEGKVSTDSTSRYTREFIGGRGIAAKILYDECGPEVRPFDPGSLLIFSVAPLAGTSIPGTGRVAVTCKSPVTLPEGLMVDTGFGGFWGPELKFAGYDHLIVSGRASHPVYITIDNGDVRIENAEHLWGKDAFEAVKLIKGAFDIDARVVSIGQAGENLVRFASILGGEQYSATGRGGSGAVMGSKNLKGIAVRGTGEVKVADPKKLLEITREWHELIKDYWKATGYEFGAHQGGLIKLMHNMTVAGNYETFDSPLLETFESDPDEFFAAYQVKRVGCMGCPQGTFHYVRVPGLPPAGVTCANLGNSGNIIWNNDPYTTVKTAILCNTYCMDTIEVTGCIAFMMELYTRGIITEKDTDGIAFERGSKEAIIDAVHKIAKRESYGDPLAEGVPRAAEKIGRDAMEYAVHTKGLFPHGYLFQAMTGHALLQAVGGMTGDPFPVPVPLRLEMPWVVYPQGDLAGRKVGKERYGTEKALDPSDYSEVKVDAAIDTEHRNRGPDLLGGCIRYLYFIPDTTALETFNAATGMGLTFEALVRAEERLVHLERAFDVREGVRRENDRIPNRWLTEKVPEGRHKGAIIDAEKHEEMKDAYYRKRGWNVKTGIPKRKTLEKFGLSGVAQDLEQLKAP